MNCPKCGILWNGIKGYQACTTKISGTCLGCGETYADIDAIELLKEAEKEIPEE